MLILSFDSTAKAASVALTEGTRLLGLSVTDNGLTHSELLLPMAERLLSEAGKSFEDIELYACNVGPGSFTGVRIGVALVKGLAFGRSIPVAAVSTLHSLAENAVPLDGILCPVMDARRSQVYNALFEMQNGECIRLTPDRAIAVDALLSELHQQYPNKTIRVIGDGAPALMKAGADFAALTPVPELLMRENAYSTARIAAKMVENGVTLSARELSPVYLRMPQAERERLEKINAEKANKCK